MKSKSLESVLRKPSVEFFEDHPTFGKHVYATQQGELYTGCTTISDAWDKSFFLGPWYAKEMALALGWYDVKNQDGTKKSKEKLLDEKLRFEQMWEQMKRQFTAGDFFNAIAEAKGAAKRKSDQAKTDGGEAHDWIEAGIGAKIDPSRKLIPMPQSEEGKNAVNAFIGWAKGIANITWIASEEVICSDVNKIAGKLDAIASIDGIPYLVDFKTSGQLSPSYLLQCAGYDIMLREMGFQVAGYIIVRIPKGIFKDGVLVPQAAETLTITNREDMQFFRETFIKQREAHKFYVFMESKFKDASGKMKVDPPLVKVEMPPLTPEQGKNIKPGDVLKVDKPNQEQVQDGHSKKPVRSRKGGGKDPEAVPPTGGKTGRGRSKVNR